MIRPRRLTLALIWCLLVLGIALLLGGINLPRLIALNTAGAKTVGTVLSTEANNHRTVRYAYSVGGARYSSSAQGDPGAGDPRFADLRPGTRVGVVYDPANPSSAGLGDQAANLRNELLSVACAALLFPTLLVFIIRAAVVPRGLGEKSGV